MALTAEKLCEIALEAGALIMDVYASDFDVERKDDSSPVTEADEKAERL
ncbi:MAG: 3'(2'),5'-bisphosphate nucleotidase CysQ, partial [Pseudomonadota bacterium]